MKNKKNIIIAAAIVLTTGAALLIGTGGAKALGLDSVNKIIDAQLNKLVPDNFKKILSNVRTGSAIGVNDIVTIFKPADETGNINEEVWKELDQISLGASSDKILKAAGVRVDNTLSQLTQTSLKNINNSNNSRGRAIEKAVTDERADIQETLKTEAIDADSSLEATNQSKRIAAVAAGIELRKADLQARSLTAQQIANANALKQRQEQITKQRSEQMASKAMEEEQSNLTNITTRPYYGGQ